jgi:sugar phosphate isomerase/epimerase
MNIELGCFTRPWGEAGLSFDEALAGIAAAGYERAGLPSLRAGGSLLPAEVTEADLDALESRLASHNLLPHVAFGNPDLSLRRREAVALLRQELQYAHRLGLRYIVLTGTDDEKQYDDWFAAVAGALDTARDLGLTLLLKPHGGLSALAEDLLRALERLRHHPGFGLCYDPGNIYYYTGQRARDDLPKVAQHVRAMCIKDEIGGRHGQVMITPGTGLVDFRAICAILAKAGFSGPCWVECLGGRTLAEINQDAVKAHTLVTRLAENA